MMHGNSNIKFVYPLGRHPLSVFSHTTYGENSTDIDNSTDTDNSTDIDSSTDIDNSPTCNVTSRLRSYGV